MYQPRRKRSVKLKKILYPKPGIGQKKEKESKPSAPQNRLIILFDPERCTGCRRCEEACSVRHKGKADALGSSSLRVVHHPAQNSFLLLSCFQCKDAPCTAVCPQEVLRQEREYGPLTIDQARCATCACCAMACPFEILHLNENYKITGMCDLCSGAPECVKCCPAGALEQGEVSKENLERKRRLVRKFSVLWEDMEK
jgi:Fe-S-cluster-containing dehydrogenase component